MSSSPKVPLLFLGLVAASLSLHGLAMSEGTGFNWKADVSSADIDPNELLGIEIDSTDLDLDEGETVTLSAYGIYSTRTVAMNMEWSLSGDKAGYLSCGNTPSRTCDYTAPNYDSDTNVVIEREQDDEIYEDHIRVRTEDSYYSSYNEDLPSWAESSIERVQAWGLMTGYEDGTFGSADSVTRGQYTVMLARLMVLYGVDIDALLEGKDCDLYSDIDSDHYAYDAACVAHHYNWLEGITLTGSTYGAETPILRKETAQLIYNVVGELALEAVEPEELYRNHMDIIADIFFDDLNAWQLPPESAAMGTMYWMGWMRGTSVDTEDDFYIYFYPETSLSRGEAAVILDRIVTKLDEVNFAEIVQP